MFKPIGEYLDTGDDYLRLWIRLAAVVSVLPFAARTRLLDNLDEGPKAISEMAAATGFDAGQLARAVNFLAAEQIVDVLEDGRIAANARTKAFQRYAGSTIWCVTGHPTFGKISKPATPPKHSR